MSSEVISTTIISAPAGFYLLWASYYKEEDCFTDKAPIIAWKVILYDNDTVAREPILATESDYNGKDCYGHAVLAPDGWIYNQEESRQIASVEDWTKETEHYFANFVKKKKA